MQLSKTYDPKQVENKIYQLWLKSGFFNPDKLPKTHKKPYSIVIPPPNITGQLHMGHALNAVIQDILIRQKRMQGLKTLWLPGTDHAGIATQNVVEKKLKKEGKTRFDLGREKFIEEVWKWKEEYGDIILNQFKKLGCSCDWSKTRFTMDEDYSSAVKEAFLHYYNKGWIYRAKKIINWCPRCATSLSDLELEYQEEKGKLCYIKYPLKRNISHDREKYFKWIMVATTRPETMLGDTAVAVNPKDKRYKNLVGKKVILPLVNREIPIVADILVNSKFGTGAVKVTPAHDITDYQISQRHKLEMRQVINEKGKIINSLEQYNGLKIEETRQKIVEDLKNQGLLEKIEDYIHQVPKCYRCNTTVELIPSQQWFLKMDKLAKLSIEAVEDDRVKFHPKSFEKPYLDWLKNIRDWCISRQLWWGHKVPLEGETDVLDTWFSSALWPFAALGWPASAKASAVGSTKSASGQTKSAGKPKKTSDLDTFYPTDVLSTARDIINLWVARMIFSGMEFMDKIPFRNVYIHATILTKEGKRMSKSLGTGVDPINLIEQYGADATRFGIAFQIMGGQNLRFVADNIVMGKKFCNKIWNASRFVLGQFSKEEKEPSSFKKELGSLKKEPSSLTLADKKILNQLDKTIKSVNSDLENFKFGRAAHTVYDFFWHDFCDVYIEKFKTLPRSEPKVLLRGQKILLYVLLTSLKLLHPFVPFITEEVYQKLPLKDKKKCLMIEKWPSAHSAR